MSRATTRLIVLALALAAFGLSLTVSRGVFERLPHLEDEVTYLFQAKIFARGEVVAPLVEPARAYWQPFVIEYEDVRFGKYSPGWPALLSVGLLMGMGAWVNAAMAALTVVLVYRLGADTFGRDAGLIAAALVTFSPMAILLNASLMSHTSALTFATLFMWAVARVERGGGLRWGVVAGLALGALAANRPLSAVAVAAPFIVWNGVRVLKSLVGRHGLTVRGTLAPLLALSACALLVAAAVPWFNWATTGDPTANLYTLVPGWEYDRVGFGPDIGRNGHTLTKGIQFARYDLSLTAADLFGWQASPWSPMLTDWAVGIAPPGMVADSYWPAAGLSFMLLPLGIAVGLRRTCGYVWAGVGLAWVWSAATFNYTQPELWAVFGVGWLTVGLIMTAWVHDDRRAAWTWLVVGVLFSIVAAHMAYWIGSQRYSTRYYFEAVTAAALLASLPLAALARRGGVWRWAVYGGLAAACLVSYLGYSIPRVSALRGYNRITAEVLDGVAARRTSDAPVLVIVTGADARWRTRGALMAVSSPFLDGEIEFAYNDLARPDRREVILSRAVGRQVIEMGADVNDVWFTDACTDSGCPPANRIDNPTPLDGGG